MTGAGCLSRLWLVPLSAALSLLLLIWAAVDREAREEVGRCKI